MLGDLAGTAPLREALLETNALLAQVLDELRTTNRERLAEVADRLRAVQDAVEAAVADPVAEQEK